MRRLSLPFAALALSAASPAPKPLAVADVAESVFVSEQGAAFPVTLAAGKCDRLVARVARLAIGARQLRSDLLTAVLIPSVGPGSATLLLRDSTVAAPAASPTPGCPVVFGGGNEAKPSGSLLDQGDYTAIVTVSLADGSRPEPLKLSFKKPPAVLKTDATLRLERVLRGPFPDGTSVAVLHETSGLWPIHLRPPPYRATLTGAGTVTAVLVPQRPSSKDAPASKEASPAAAVIPAGEAGLFDVSYAGDAKVGTARGSLTVRAPELAGGAVSIPIELVVRRTRFWLFLLIIVGLAAGYILRHALERRRKLELALAEAYVALRPLQNLQDQALDPDEVVSLAQLRSPLDEAIAAPAATAETITVAVTAFKTSFATKLTEMATRRSRAAAALSDWSAPLAEVYDQPKDVASRLQAFEAEIRGARDALGARLSKPAEDLSARIRTALRQGVAPALSTWVSGARAAVDSLPEWPEEPVAKGARDRVIGALDAVDSVALTEEPASFVSLLRQSSRAMRVIRNDLLGIRAKVVKDYALELQAAASQLQAVPAAAEPIAAAEQARIAMIEAAAKDPDAGLAEYGAAEQRLFRAWSDVIEAAGGKPEDPAVSGDRFLEALKALAPKRRALGPGGAEPPAPQSGPDPLFSIRPVPERALIGRFRIAAPSSAWLGEQIHLTLQALEEGVSAPPRVRWILGTQEVLGGVEIDFQPPLAGTLSVQAVIDGQGDTPHVAFASIEIMRRLDSRAETNAADKARSIERVQTSFSAVLISAFGFAILGPAFVGSWDQMVAAFAWGFATDLGMAKAFELASPVTTAQLKASQ
jgi:hypothetical protein